MFGWRNRCNNYQEIRVLALIITLRRENISLLVFGGSKPQISKSRPVQGPLVGHPELSRGNPMRSQERTRDRIWFCVLGSAGFQPAVAGSLPPAFRRVHIGIRKPVSASCRDSLCNAEVTHALPRVIAFDALTVCIVQLASRNHYETPICRPRVVLCSRVLSRPTSSCPGRRQYQAGNVPGRVSQGRPRQTFG